MRKIPPKGGSRVDPTYLARGTPLDPGDGWSRRGAGVSVGMVAVAPGSPGRCQASSYRAASSPARRRFSCAAAHYEAGDEYCSRADGCTSHRREVGARQLAFAASEAAHGTTETRSSTGTRRDVVGFGHRIFVAGSAQRGVRAVADGVRTLPRMARRRPLAADSGSAPAPPMMQTAHSRDRSGTVGLEAVREGR
jgi:hypothetical protein